MSRSWEEVLNLEGGEIQGVWILTQREQTVMSWNEFIAQVEDELDDRRRESNKLIRTVIEDPYISDKD